MKAGKPQDQALAIAYDVKRRNRKKMAKGGMIPTPKPAQKGMINEELSIEAADKKRSEHPAHLESQLDEKQMRPAKDEYMANRMGGRFAKGGMINEIVSMSRAEEDGEEHPEGLEEDDDQMHPPVDEYMASRMGGRFAHGGMINEDLDREMRMQPEPEEEDEHEASLVAAIMAKRRKANPEPGDDYMNGRRMMAQGGDVVDIEENGEEEPNQYYGINREILKENYDSDFEDMEQPKDSNEHGDDIESDSHDMVSQIRRKMRAKRL